MIYENEIPEYALQPARSPEIIGTKPIYSAETIMCPIGVVTAEYEFEEDMLVPDVKPDMGEILLMKGTCDVSPTEKDVVPKTDDLLNLTGNLNIQTIYRPFDSKDELVPIRSRVPYKYQWNLSPDEACTGRFSCEIKKLDFMIVNERKIRIKVVLQFTGKYYASTEYKFFDGLEDEKLEVKEEKINITSLAMQGHDDIDIDETFSVSDKDISPDSILRQDFVIIENYRQITPEKIVVNGFIYCNMLYVGTNRSAEEEKQVYMHHSQRIEFTQFIPINKEIRGKRWNCCRLNFGNKGLEVNISVTEEKEYNFHVKGKVGTYVQLYETLEKSVITDAYHREKDFTCTFSTRNMFNIVAIASSETSLREIITLPKDSKIGEVIYTSGEIMDCNSSCEKGRVNVSGTMLCHILLREREGGFISHDETVSFRGCVEDTLIESHHNISCHAILKNLWCEVVNESQVELNGQIVLRICGSEDKSMVTIENPGFIVKDNRESEFPMVIAVVDKNQSLWDLAKKYKTTARQILSANKMEGEPVAGQKILIVK